MLQSNGGYPGKNKINSHCHLNTNVKRPSKRDASTKRLYQFLYHLEKVSTMKEMKRQKVLRQFGKLSVESVDVISLVEVLKEFESRTFYELNYLLWHTPDAFCYRVCLDICQVLIYLL